MTEHKRGDHVFNMGLRKTLTDLARCVRDVLVRDGHNEQLWARATRMQRRIGELAEALTSAAFELSVDKPASVAADPNAQQFGAANEQFVFAFRNVLEAIRLYYTVLTEPDWSSTRLGLLNTACLHGEMAVHRWIDAGFDAEAAALITREQPRAARWIADAKARLESLRTGLVQLLRDESPRLPVGSLFT